MKSGRLVIIFTFSFLKIFSQESDTSYIQKHIEHYPFIIQDSPAKLFTIRQTNEDYLSFYRYSANLLNKNFSPLVSYSIQASACFLAFTTWTHEEAHRSVLTSKGIGAYIEPFELSNFDGYVSGVTDATLQNLRDTDFPTFIRLYTAGFELDYMLAKHEETIFSFENDETKNVIIEYLMRKGMLVQYFVTGLLKIDIDGAEEPDELQRDIVGNDFYGAVRHLHRPNMAFQRYTRYNDLTSTEVSYMKKVGSRTFLNLINANIIGIRNFSISENSRINFGLGHCMGPFGDYIDEWFWFKYQNTIKISAYLREYENENYWFPACGVSLNDFQIGKRFLTTLSGHFWDEPNNLSFTENTGKTGGAIDVTCRYKIFANQKTNLKNISFDCGLTLKSYGFLPEEMYIDKHFGFRLGASFYFQ